MANQRNRNYLETILANPKQFFRDVFASFPRNKKELKRNVADYNENLILMLTGGPYAKRRYPRPSRFKAKDQPGTVERAFLNMLGEREAARRRMESRFRRVK